MIQCQVNADAPTDVSKVIGMIKFEVCGWE